MKSVAARVVSGIVISVLLGISTVSGKNPYHSQTAASQQTGNSDDAAKTYFTDVLLVNQNGQEMRLFSDLMRGKTVIIIPFFTSCSDACPAMNQNLRRIQDWLGDRLGKDAHMISISVDPATDRVPKLHEYANRLGARPGWFFLGGKPENVEFALKKLGQYVKAREDHSNIMIIGNLKTGLWKKALSLAASELLIPIVDSVLNDKGEKGN